MDTSIAAQRIPSEQDIANLQQQVAEAKRLAKYKNLQKELRTRSKKGDYQHPTLLHHVLAPIRKMFRILPIWNQIVWISVTGLVLFSMYRHEALTGMPHHQSVLIFLIQVFAGYKIISSTRYSLLLSTFAVAIGWVMTHLAGAHASFLYFDRVFYQDLLITGYIGLGMGVLSVGNYLL